MYSDFFFYTMPRIVKYQTGVDFETYIKSPFYRPLGIHSPHPEPFAVLPSGRIVPTRRDTFSPDGSYCAGRYTTKERPCSAAFQGHAGLLVQLMIWQNSLQMYMNYGAYGG
ncbi:MAG: hypothetical protein IPN20_01085, partial [Haliscomenobacter sp.]|nr:hypothetical protein [Haliscomenobacter sp.]